MSSIPLTLRRPSKVIQGTVQLTGSKSESNRALIIKALSRGAVKVENLSAAADTVIMKKALTLADTSRETGESVTVDIGPAGTAMRFLTSYLNLVEGNFILTGTERMQQRPIGILVDALKTLGANIEYEKKSGFPPLEIKGGMVQKKQSVHIKGNVSSQYLSSLLLIAASLKQGLVLEIEGELTSRPYVTMTLDMLQEAGISHTWIDNTIEIAPQEFKPTTIYVEPDWSAASYWYAIVALSKKGEVVLPGLKAHSLQGDIAIVDIMTHFGVASSFQEDGLHIAKVNEGTDKVLFDFKACPDLAQTIVALAAAIRRDISITGVETLKIKETDRLAALKNEIEKFGATIVADGETYHIKAKEAYAPKQVTFDTYEDHRMAMAFAPLALIFDEVTINDPVVVEKSYPNFWEHLQQQGFTIEQ
ncbi:3-phosphoshikimate 1-carboxyvinyltransferase [Sphingobacterium chuzhouense]|uniref:3-phosphoshikimate 1-carboxyvinyltransferase n=1 Tax=Sphingobacterium chuzhouense TaxID=1742264 RepID=A0ABR7XUK6_9SPHI|nr:3-phosphoshikimate 1-carboxyvinyltransferase [Sphingobacterium chuzhouense]MBD1422723.1 3-phosphoshikimate 1-carboxyvinyltransferase [Sphingobacterium chuzhouense]